MNINIQGRLKLQDNGRYAIYHELSSGSIVEVLIEGKWERTTIESSKGAYYLTNGYSIDGAVVRIPD